MNKRLLIAGSVLSTLALGHQVVSADTVPTTTDTSTAQSVQETTKALPQVKAVVLSANTDVVSDASSTVDDGTTVDNGETSSNDGTTVDNGGSSSSSDNGGSSSSSDNGGSSSSDNDGSSSSNNGGGTDSSTTGDNGSSSDNNTVPLTPTTPDTNNQGEINHVTPVEVTPNNSGNVVSVPTQVASVPSVARAVEAYNQALTANDKDATKAPVVEAKQKLDDAVDKALPLTHATEKSSMGGSGILALAMSGSIAWQDYASDSPYPDQQSLIFNEIKSSPEKLERFRNEFAHQMYDNVINHEMQRLEHDI